MDHNVSSPSTTPTPSPGGEDTTTQALLHAFFMIIVSEIGDKTFLIAAILAMRHPRLIVFLGAFGSLFLMSILSAEMGHILPSLIPKQWTQLAAAVLFLVFGVKMGIEARAMEGGAGKIREEMKEVEEELEMEEARIDGTGKRTEGEGVVTLEAVEEGEARAGTTGEQGPQGIVQGATNLLQLCFGPAFIQAFVLTFLGEWGDRSQIATIALGANHNVYLVSLGTVIGHGACTSLAVLGGRYLSTKISVKHVTLGGSILFLLFAILYFHEAWTSTDSPAVHILHPEHADHEIQWRNPRG